MPHPPKSLPPSWGEGVTAYAATDEGASVPRPASIGRAGLGPVSTQRPKGTRRGGFQPPEKPSPHRGEGVTAYAVTDEGSSFPCPSRGMAKGVPPCGAGPFPSDGKETKGSPGETHIAVGNKFPPAPVRSPPVPRLREIPLYLSAKFPARKIWFRV